MVPVATAMTPPEPEIIPSELELPIISSSPASLQQSLHRRFSTGLVDLRECLCLPVALLTIRVLPELEKNMPFSRPSAVV